MHDIDPLHRHQRQRRVLLAVRAPQVLPFESSPLPIRYRSRSSRLTLVDTQNQSLQEEGDAREIRWHIDSLPQHSSSGLDRLVFNQDSTPDVITAVAASDSMLLIARASGNIIRYR